jgi:uncharacterized protein YbaR (Trm112 family)
VIDARLLEVVVCPRCHSSLAPAAASLACANSDCGLVYRVSHGVPVLLVDEARSAADEGEAGRER